MVFLGRKEKRVGERDRRLLESMDTVQQDVNKVAHYDNGILLYTILYTVGFYFLISCEA